MSDRKFQTTDEVMRIAAIWRLEGEVEDNAAEFDRWLTQHDAEVKAQAAAGVLRAAAKDPALRLSGHSGISITRLLDRADQIAATTTTKES